MNRDTTIIAEEVNVKVFVKEGLPEAGWIFDGQVDDVFFAFAHNNEIWKVNIAATMELAIEGGGPETLLFNVNGHYAGVMPENVVDKIVGTVCALYRLSKKEPVIPPPVGLVS